MMMKNNKSTFLNTANFFGALLLLTLFCLAGGRVVKADTSIGTIPAGNNPNAIAVNPVTNKIYAVNNGGNTVTVLNGTNDTVAATITVGTNPVDVEVNPVTNKIYVVNGNSDNVTVINGASNTVTATITVGTGPNAVAVNPVTNKIYTANFGSMNVSVIDGATNTVTATVAADAGAIAVAVNPVTDRIYVPNYNANNLTVINGTNNTVAATVTTSTNPIAVAVNPITNKIYVPNQFSPDVTVIDGATNSPTTVAAGVFPDAVAVNPISGKVYVPNQSDNNVTVITPAPTNTIPLNTAVTPLAGNTTNSSNPTFTLTATSTYAPTTPPPRNIYFQVDTANGTWTTANNTGSTATTVTASATTANLDLGVHIIYFYAADGSDATSINPNTREGDFSGPRAPESSPVIGGINAYLFLVTTGPTAAPVSVSGYVLTNLGRAPRGASVTLTDLNGNAQTTTVNRWGHYQFTDIEPGQTYFLTATAKGFSFTPPTQLVTPNFDQTGLNFTAFPRLSRD